MSLKRRDFLKTTMAGAASVVTVTPSVNGAENPKKVGRKVVSSDPFAKIPLTKTINCTRIGFGMGMHGGSHLRDMPGNSAIDLLHYAYDLGIRLFDTADSYKTHDLLCRAMKDKPRDSYTIISKFNPRSATQPDGTRVTARSFVERFLKELETDYIDLIQLHCQIKEDWPKLWPELMAELEELKQKGLIRAHGLTTHSLVAVQTAAQTPWVDAIHVRLNPYNTRMDGSWDDNVKALEDCHNAGLGTVIMKVIGEGSLRDPAQRKKSVDSIVRLDAADVMVVGFDAKSEVDELVANVTATLKAMEAENKS